MHCSHRFPNFSLRRPHKPSCIPLSSLFRKTQCRRAMPLHSTTRSGVILAWAKGLKMIPTPSRTCKNMLDKDQSASYWSLRRHEKCDYEFVALHNSLHSRLDTYYTNSSNFTLERRKYRVNLTHRLSKDILLAVHELRHMNMIRNTSVGLDALAEQHVEELTGMQREHQSELQSVYDTTLRADYQEYYGLKKEVIHKKHDWQSEFWKSRLPNPRGFNIDSDRIDRVKMASLQHLDDIRDWHASAVSLSARIPRKLHANRS